jgi:hypothetical protein
VTSRLRSEEVVVAGAPAARVAAPSIGRSTGEVNRQNHPKAVSKGPQDQVHVRCCLAPASGVQAAPAKTLRALSAAAARVCRTA